MSAPPRYAAEDEELAGTCGAEAATVSGASDTRLARRRLSHCGQPSTPERKIRPELALMLKELLVSLLRLGASACRR